MHVLAYIDPGSGSLLIQAVIAALIAVPFAFRQNVKKVVARFRRRPEEPPPETPENS